MAFVHHGMPEVTSDVAPFGAAPLTYVIPLVWRSEGLLALRVPDSNDGALANDCQDPHWEERSAQALQTWSGLSPLMSVA